jgi:hypothetical protein
VFSLRNVSLQQPDLDVSFQENLVPAKLEWCHGMDSTLFSQLAEMALSLQRSNGSC